MGKNLYIGDLHIGHDDILWLDNRPFKSLKEMEATIIKNWQAAVAPDDNVYVLGDMFWETVPETKRAQVLSQLPGHKILIRGNHDQSIVGEGWAGIVDAMNIYDGRDRVYLYHYPTIAHKGFYDGTVQLYAHVHNSYENAMADRTKQLLEKLYGKTVRMYNVGCMMPWMDYTPRTLEEIETTYAKHMLNAAYGYRPEVSSMLTLSSAHISEETVKKLDQEADLNAMGLSIYSKSSGNGESFGWFIYIPQDGIPGGIPDDLKRCIAKAQEQGCQILCLDYDGLEDPSLETFDW